MKILSWQVVLGSGLAAIAGCSCAEEGFTYTPGGASADGGTSAAACYSSNECPPGQYCNEFYRCVWPNGSVDGGFVVPETEPLIGRPQGGLHHVYVAMTALDSVARIDAETLQVTSLAVGDAPSALAAASGQDLAVVLNRGSGSASILSLSGGVDHVQTLATLPDLNQLRMAPDGRVAVAFYQLDDPGARAVGSLQDVSLLYLAAGQEHVSNISVGFRPSEVVFAPDSSAAYVVTEDGVSSLTLDPTAGDFVAPAVALSGDPMAEGPPAEVLVTADGRLAFARWDDLPALRSVELTSGALVDTPLGGVPTDIDLTPDGTKLLAVIRETSSLALLNVPADIGHPEQVLFMDCSPLQAGQATVGPDGHYALVFTNTLDQKALLRADLVLQEKIVLPLRKGVRAIAFAPDSQTAVVLHNKAPGDPAAATSLEEVLNRRYGYSLLDVPGLFAKLQLTDANPGSLAFLPDSSAAYVLVASAETSTRQVAIANLQSFITTTLTMGSLPTDIGTVVGSDRVYVLQDHPMGRISFVHARSGEVRTVTGFELNSQITE